MELRAPRVGDAVDRPDAAVLGEVGRRLAGASPGCRRRTPPAAVAVAISRVDRRDDAVAAADGQAAGRVGEVVLDVDDDQGRPWVVALHRVTLPQVADSSEAAAPARVPPPRWRRAGRWARSGRLAPEDADGGEDQRLEDRPADEGEDCREVEDRAGRPRARRFAGCPRRAPTKIWLVLRMNDTRSLPSRASSRSRTIRRRMSDLDDPEDEDDDPAGDRAAARTHLDRPARDRGAVVSWADGSSSVSSRWTTVRSSYVMAVVPPIRASAGWRARPAVRRTSQRAPADPRARTRRPSGRLASRYRLSARAQATGVASSSRALVERRRRRCSADSAASPPLLAWPGLDVEQVADALERLDPARLARLRAELAADARLTQTRRYWRSSRYSGPQTLVRSSVWRTTLPALAARCWSSSHSVRDSWTSSPLRRDHPPLEVDLDVVEREDAGAGLDARRAAEDRADAGRQLVGVERLGDVVVGAEVEALGLVGGRALGGQQDDRRRAAARAAGA